MLACSAIAGMGAAAAGTAPGDWTIEDVAEPSYAVAEPARTNLNIDVVALVCEEGRGAQGLQLQLYLTGPSALQPVYPHTLPFRDDPRAEVWIDEEIYPVALLFADDFVILADARQGPFPMLSDPLIDAMQRGRTMTLRFDLLSERSGPPAFDGEAVVDLQARGAAEAMAALRWCVEGSRRTYVAEGTRTAAP
jgi:hypothetical protein